MVNYIRLWICWWIRRWAKVQQEVMWQSKTIFTIVMILMKWFINYNAWSSDWQIITNPCLVDFRIGILIIDEKSHNTPAALAAAQRVRDDGIKMIVIGVEVRKLYFYSTNSHLPVLMFHYKKFLFIRELFRLTTCEYTRRIICLNLKYCGSSRTK